jgi:hypothetical protein
LGFLTSETPVPPQAVHTVSPESDGFMDRAPQTAPQVTWMSVGPSGSQKVQQTMGHRLVASMVVAVRTELLEQ